MIPRPRSPGPHEAPPFDRLGLFDEIDARFEAAPEAAASSGSSYNFSPWQSMPEDEIDTDKNDSNPDIDEGAAAGAAGSDDDSEERKKPGPKPPLTKLEFKKLATRLEDLDRMQRSPTMREFKALVLEHHRASLIERGFDPMGADVKHRTVQRLRNQFDITIRKVRSKSTARVLAEMQIRNNVSLAALIGAKLDPDPDFTPARLIPSMIWNIDSTQVQFAGMHPKKVLATKKGKKKSKKQALNKEVEKEGDLHAKLVICVSAAGQKAAPLFLYSHKLAPQGLTQLQVPGLHPDGRSIGHIWVYRDIPMKDILTWIFKQLVIPEIKKSRAAITQSLTSKRAAVLLDGEIPQVRATVDDAMLATFKEEGMCVVKFPGNTTGTLQPLDNSPCFCSLKTFIRNSSREETEDPDNPALAGLMDVMTESDLPAAIQKHLIKLVKVCRPSLLERALVTYNIKKGFKDVGVWPFSVEKILSRCRGEKMSVEMGQRVRKAVVSLTSAVR